jgi:hypothetical protein
MLYSMSYWKNAPDIWLRHLQFPTCAMCWLLRAPDKSFPHTLHSLNQWPQASLFILQLTGSHSAGISCTTQIVLSIGGSVWYLVWNFHCTIKIDSVLAHSKTELFLIPCPYQAAPWLAPSGETCKYAMVHATQTNLERFSTYWYAPFCCVCLGCCVAEFGSAEGTHEFLCIKGAGIAQLV